MIAAEKKASRVPMLLGNTLVVTIANDDVGSDDACLCCFRLVVQVFCECQHDVDRDIFVILLFVFYAY